MHCHMSVKVVTPRSRQHSPSAISSNHLIQYRGGYDCECLPGVSVDLGLKVLCSY